MSEKIKILIADKIDLTHLKILNTKYFDITCRIGMSDSDLLNYSYLNNFKVLLIKSRRKIDKTFLSRCGYETIGTASKGTDHIDVDYAKKKNATVIIRGLRALSDFEFEFQMSLTNRKLAPEVTTMFLMPNEKYTYLNSSLVRELSKFKGDISSFVPPVVEKSLKLKLKQKL